MALDLIPQELQNFIIRLLDPIGLISISQTSAQFRRPVKPEKKHFAERLLALEILVEYGGVTPIFRSRDNNLDPDWMDAQWDEMRWACTGCLRLLPHEHFDNHSILRLRYRNPVPGSAAADMVTTWEPTKARKVHALEACDILGPRGMSRDKFEQMTSSEKYQMLDEMALLVEYERCGLKRYLRKCNECRFLRGELAPRLNGFGGTLTFPILPSRRVLFGTPLDRHFPGFSDYLENKRPSCDPPVTRIYRDNAHNQLWTMYMARCPKCVRWVELREFRINGDYQDWKPVLAIGDHEATTTWDGREITESLLNESLCNACFAQTNGRSELNKVLHTWINSMIHLQLLNLSWQLECGWGDLQSILKTGVPKQYQSEVKDLLKHPTNYMGDSFSPLAKADIALMRLRQTQWKEIWERMKKNGDTNWTEESMDVWYDGWISNFEDSEVHWRWLMESREEFEEKPDALAAWALSRKREIFR
ncbi:hypothetical protein QQX98_004434 [Neonectria punicea]|uniref:F-box domain-containing protein n=1 Tax=Neonectria punicea TaxID=979145 RepID=A0ABR1H8Z4_9HYPO